jgi:hypothetical protein
MRDRVTLVHADENAKIDMITVMWLDRERRYFISTTSSAGEVLCTGGRGGGKVRQDMSALRSLFRRCEWLIFTIQRARKSIAITGVVRTT